MGEARHFAFSFTDRPKPITYIAGTYQVRPHLIPETGTDVAYGLANKVDRCSSSSIETVLEGIDARRVYDALIKTVPTVNDTFAEKVTSQI